MPKLLLWRVSVAILLLTQAAASAGNAATLLAVDPAESRVRILVGKAGFLSFAGHVHEITAPVARGSVTVDLADWARATISLEFEAAALRVTGAQEPPGDVPEVQRVMLSAQVLDVARFPTMAFRSTRLSVTSRTANSAEMLIEGDFTLHGTTRAVRVRADVTLDAEGHLTARGSFSLKQTDYGMTPVTAAGGTVRVKDALDIEFVLKANPSHDTRTGR